MGEKVDVVVAVGHDDDYNAVVEVVVVAAADIVFVAVAEGQPLTNPGFVDNEFFSKQSPEPASDETQILEVGLLKVGGRSSESRRSVFRKSEVSLDEAQVRRPELDTRKKWSFQVRKLI